MAPGSEKETGTGDLDFFFFKSIFIWDKRSESQENECMLGFLLFISGSLN